MHVGQLAHGTPSGCKLGHRMPPSASSTPREIVKIKTQRRLSTTKERERERERGVEQSLIQPIITSVAALAALLFSITVARFFAASNELEVWELKDALVHAFLQICHRAHHRSRFLPWQLCEVVFLQAAQHLFVCSHAKLLRSILSFFTSFRRCRCLSSSLNRFGVILFEVFLCSEEAFMHEIHHLPELFRIILDRRSRQAIAAVCDETTNLF